MPRRCTICDHPQHHAIDHALVAAEAFRNISKRFGTSTTALHRHKHEHLLEHLADVRQPQPAVSDTPQPPTEPAHPAQSPEAARVLQRYQATAREVEFFRALDAQAWRRFPSPAMVYDHLVVLFHKSS